MLLILRDPTLLSLSFCLVTMFKYRQLHCMFCLIVLRKSMSLRRYGGVPCISTAEEQWTSVPGPVQLSLIWAGEDCVEVSSLMTLDRQEETVWDACPSVTANTMKTCVCFTCPLSSSPSGWLDLFRHKMERGDRTSLIYYVATQMPFPQISCDTRSSQLKILQGLGRVAMTDLT